MKENLENEQKFFARTSRFKVVDRFGLTPDDQVQIIPHQSTPSEYAVLSLSQTETIEPRKVPAYLIRTTPEVKQELFNYFQSAGAKNR